MTGVLDLLCGTTSIVCGQYMLSIPGGKHDWFSFHFTAGTWQQFTWCYPDDLGLLFPPEASCFAQPQTHLLNPETRCGVCSLRAGQWFYKLIECTVTWSAVVPFQFQSSNLDHRSSLLKSCWNVAVQPIAAPNVRIPGARTGFAPSNVARMYSQVVALGWISIWKTRLFAMCS